MRNILVICICALLSVPVAMANHHGDKKKMETIKKQTKPRLAERAKDLKRSDLKKSDAKLRKLDAKEGEVTAECCGTRPGAPPPPPPPPPNCEGGTDTDCDDDSDYDPDPDTDGPAPSEVQTDTPGR